MTSFLRSLKVLHHCARSFQFPFASAYANAREAWREAFELSGAGGLMFASNELRTFGRLINEDSNKIK